MRDKRSGGRGLQQNQRAKNKNKSQRKKRVLFSRKKRAKAEGRTVKNGSQSNRKGV